MIQNAFRTSIRCAPRYITRTPLPSSRAIAPCLFVPHCRNRTSPRQVIRCYSAPAGLSKPEVEGRIMDLLKNFDKVGFRDGFSDWSYIHEVPSRSKMQRRYIIFTVPGRIVIYYASSCQIHLISQTILA